MSAKLEALYRKLPSMHCKGKCAGACGPIGMSEVEADNLRQHVGERIQLAPIGDGNVLVTNFAKGTLTCPLLTNGRCAAYEARPMICRLWGMVKPMRCPHGCRPSRWLSDAESRAFLEAARRLSAK